MQNATGLFVSSVLHYNFYCYLYLVECDWVSSERKIDGNEKKIETETNVEPYNNAKVGGAEMGLSCCAFFYHTSILLLYSIHLFKFFITVSNSGGKNAKQNENCSMMRVGEKGKQKSQMKLKN